MTYSGQILNLFQNRASACPTLHALSANHPPRTRRVLVVQAESDSDVRLLEKPQLKRPTPPSQPTQPPNQKSASGAASENGQSVGSAKSLNGKSPAPSGHSGSQRAAESSQNGLRRNSSKKRNNWNNRRKQGQSGPESLQKQQQTVGKEVKGKEEESAPAEEAEEQAVEPRSDVSAPLQPSAEVQLPETPALPPEKDQQTAPQPAESQPSEALQPATPQPAASQPVKPNLNSSQALQRPVLRKPQERKAVASQSTAQYNSGGQDNPLSRQADEEAQTSTSGVAEVSQPEAEVPQPEAEVSQPEAEVSRPDGRMQNGQSEEPTTSKPSPSSATPAAAASPLHPAVKPKLKTPTMQGPPVRRSPRAEKSSRPTNFQRKFRKGDPPRQNTELRDVRREGAVAERPSPRRPQVLETQDLGHDRPELATDGGMTTDSEDAIDMPTLSAKPIVRRPETKKEQGKPWKDDVRAFRRMPSEMRVEQFERPSMDERERFSSAWRDRGNAPSETTTDTTQQAQKRGASARGRAAGKAKGKREEKQDIEKQRAFRYERRQQRQEQAKAQEREQEEIFEVGAAGMQVKELAERLAVNPGDVLKALFLKGIMAHVNQVLDKDMVKQVAEEYGVEVLDIEKEGVDAMARKTADYVDADDLDFLVPRPPVVTVMGHVDHGKTSLLDYIRKTKVAAGEAGGITQAIGAYTVDVGDTSEGEKKITFLDTPGHEAFSAMRARGTKITDIAIIVVACDDGVRPQTQEAISHAKAAKVPIVVALNKIDKEGASTEKTMQGMSEAGLLPEAWGGDIPMVPISAKKGMGIDELLETVLLVAEVAELSANPKRKARGTVVEAHLDRRMGSVATLLVATGTLRVGDVLHAGAAYGKVRSLTDSSGKNLEEAGPSIAVQLVGLSSVPVAGDEFAVLASEQEARKVASAIEDSQRLSRLQEQAGGSMVTSMTFATMDTADAEGLQYLNLVLKADASGSVEAVKAALLGLPQDRVALRFLMAAAGEITASDVQLAYASEGHIIGFNLEASESVMALAKQFGVAIKSYDVIYHLIDEIRGLMEGKLGSVEERTPLGSAEVRAVFGSGSKRVAGCMVTEGLLRKGCLAEVIRGKKTIAEGTLYSLRRVKDNVNEVQYGNECGLAVEGFQDWKEGDRIEALEVKAKKQTLEEASERQVVNSLAGSIDENDL